MADRMTPRQHWLDEAARVIDGRVAVLEEELERMRGKQHPVSNALDLGAINEAKHLARLIRGLIPKPYRGDPYKAAHDRWNRGELSKID